MFNETQDVAWDNLAILGENHSLTVNLHGLTLDDAVRLGNQLMGGNRWDEPGIRRSQVDETFVVGGTIEGTKIQFSIFCQPVAAESPFGALRAVEPEEVEV